MVKHVILWKLKDGLPDVGAIKAGIKEGLEGLRGKIPGLLAITVQTEPLGSSNTDVMLDAAFEDETALRKYAVHPAHVTIAETCVRPFTQTRMCMDFVAEA